MPRRTRFNLPTALGTEELLVAELAELGIEGRSSGKGSVSFLGDLSDGYRACLWSRIASRVLMELGHFPVNSADDLYRGVSRIRWRDHLSFDSSLAVSFTGRSPGINNSQFGARRTKDAIVDQLRTAKGQRPSVNLKDPDVRINVHLRDGKATVCVDLSGDALHLRGTRINGGKAPLKETLAAALLRLAGWPEISRSGGILVDPMCGSGTLLLEAASYALDTAPGLQRNRWGFDRWRGHSATLWADLLKEAGARSAAQNQASPVLFGSDIDRRQIQACLDNADRAGMSQLVRIQRCDLALRDAPASPMPGLVITNPPYGARMGDREELGPLYRSLGDTLRQRFLGWTAYILVEKGPLIGKIGLRPARRHILFNGPIECRLLEIPISPQPVQRLKG